jgi:hypothetical protein
MLGRIRGKQKDEKGRDRERRDRKRRRRNGSSERENKGYSVPSLLVDLRTIGVPNCKIR